MTAPWQVVSLLVDGPVLSKEAALLEHDTLPSDPDPRTLANGRSTRRVAVREVDRDDAKVHAGPQTRPPPDAG